MLEWVEWMHKRGGPFSTEVKLDRHEGRQMIQIIGTEGYREQKIYHEKLFWLDPARGFMPSTTEYQYVHLGKRANYERTDVTNAAQVGGLWFPFKAVRHSGTAILPEETKIDYAVSDVVVGREADETMSVKWPAGTQVVDMIEKVAYRVREDGGRDFIPIYDEKSRTVVRPEPGGLERKY